MEPLTDLDPAASPRPRASASLAIVAAHLVVQAALVLALSPGYASVVLLWAVPQAVYAVPFALVIALAPARRIAALLTAAAALAALVTTAYVLYARSQPLMRWF